MADTFPALVINLARATARREFQRAQLGKLGLAAEFIVATTPETLPPGELDRRADGWARPLRPTEVACLLSHRTAWERTVRMGVPALILEDDAVFSDDLPEALDALRGMSGIHYVNIETLKQKKVLSLHSQPVQGTRFSVSRLLRDRGGAGAYVLWPEGARLLLDYTERLSPLADSALLLAPGIARLQLEPAASTQAFLVDSLKGDAAYRKSSTYVGKRPPYAGVLSMLTGKLRRLRISAVIAARRLQHLGRSEERLVAFDPARIAMDGDALSEL